MFLCFFRCICPLANQITMDLSRIVHCGRPDQHHAHAGLAPHRYFTISERMFDRTHSCFYNGSIIVRACASGGALLTPHCAVQVSLRETVYVFGALLQWPGRTLIDEGTRFACCGIEASHIIGSLEVLIVLLLIR
jgi:hypothetical protein